MPTPQRTLSGVCEISTGAFTVAEMPPAYTGEVSALKVDVQFTMDGQPRSPDGATVEMYLYYETRHMMTQAVKMAVSGNRVSGTLGVDDMVLDGAPLLVIRMTDTQTGEIIVACTIALVIQDVLGVAVISARPATPSETVYVGRAPYIDDKTLHWFTWDNDTAQYVDSGVNALGGETLEQIMNAEKGRVEAEKQRVTDETARVEAEKKRVEAENNRDAVEKRRAEAENGRVTAENNRVAAEKERVQQAKENKAITDRYSEFAVDMEILPPSADGYARVEQSEKKTELFLGVPASNFAYATFWIDLVTRQLMMRVPNGFSAITFAIKNREMVVRING